MMDFQLASDTCDTCDTFFDRTCHCENAAFLDENVTRDTCDAFSVLNAWRARSRAPALRSKNASHASRVTLKPRTTGLSAKRAIRGAI